MLSYFVNYVCIATVHGKILEGENFGESASSRSKNFTRELVSSVNQRLRLGLHPCA